MSDRISEFSAALFPFSLGSDNHSGVHPRILQSLAAVNMGCTPSYGTDPVTERAAQVFSELFGADVDTHFCFNGTAANVLSLSPLVRPYHSVLVSDHAHLQLDECAAPERNLGVKLIPVPTKVGGGAKLRSEDLERFIIRGGDQHYAQVKALSITQPTELGAVYSPGEIAELSAFARRHGLWFHIDGARFINAAAAQADSLEAAKARLRAFTAGVDVLSFGGTKNGLMFGEAVIFLSERAREAARDFPYLRKQLMQLPSKTRFVSAQFIAMLEGGLWFEMARNACARAQQLRHGLAKCPGVRFTQPTDANAVFAIFDRDLEKRLRAKTFFYVWDEHTRECRLMTSWQTTTEAIDDFLLTARSSGGTL